MLITPEVRRAVDRARDYLLRLIDLGLVPAGAVIAGG